MEKKKICYLLPFFDTATDSHYFHLYDFINEAGKELNILLIIEKGSSDTSFFTNVSAVYEQKFSFLPLRVMENFLLIALARMKGYRKFYVHYSYVSAINSSVICKLSAAKNWYWSCGMMWLFKKDILNQFLIKSTLHFVDYLVTGVDVLAAGYSKNYGIPLEKIRIMPNWIDLGRFDRVYETDKLKDKYGIPRNKKIILFIHRLAARKGAHFIIPISKLLEKSYHFLVVGDGPLKEDIGNAVRNDHLENIQLLGKISNARIPEIMALADVFFMPSEEEGFPRVLIECMASGLPYVASDVGGVEEISPEAQKKFIYASGDVQAFADGIQEIIRNGKGFYEKDLQKKAREYDQKNVIGIFIGLFQK